MKKESNTLFTSIMNGDLVNLAPGVKESIAFDLVDPGLKNFTSAELWNIQRHVKARVQRRYL